METNSHQFYSELAHLQFLHGWGEETWDKPRQFWWEQPMDLDAASVIAIAVAANDESDGSDVE